MSLKEIFVEFSEKILPRLADKRRRREAEEQKTQWYLEQQHQLQAGEEIEPPWAAFPDSDPTTLWVSWRHGNGWLDNVWKPFWNKLNDVEKKEYFEKWQPPNDDWYETVTHYWDETITDKAEWYKKQREKFNAGEEIEPPWTAFPLSSIYYGWDGGYGEQWKLEIWLPFWKKLSETEQSKYLEKWQPSEDWHKTLTIDWQTKLKKNEQWFAREKQKLEDGERISEPWNEFPHNSVVYKWDEKQNHKWLEEIWIPFWNKMNEEKQNDYIKILYPPTRFDEEWFRILSKYPIENFDKLEHLLHKHNFLRESEYSWSTDLVNPYWVQFPEILSDKNSRNKESAGRWLEEWWLPFWNNMDEDEQNEYAEYINRYAGSLNEKWFQILAKYKVKNLNKFEKQFRSK